MHVFFNEAKDSKRRKEWVKFVTKQRPGFTPSVFSVLCSAQFEKACFTRNKAISTSLSIKRKLVSDAVPTIDVAGIPDTPIEISKRQRRQVIVICRRVQLYT